MALHGLTTDTATTHSNTSNSIHNQLHPNPRRLRLPPQRKPPLRPHQSLPPLLLHHPLRLAHPFHRPTHLLHTTGTRLCMGGVHGRARITGVCSQKNVRASPFDLETRLLDLVRTVLRNLMYGFGDDRNPASDSVNVMEEILIEYIIDVVCSHVHSPQCLPRLI